MDYSIRFPSENVGALVTYVDANHARDRDTRRSTRGIIYKIGEAPIVATSKLQPTVSRSTAEAEYHVTLDATSNVKYFRRLMTNLGINIKARTVIYGDNQSSIKMVHNPVMHENTKHIDIHYHFVRELQEHGHVDVQYISTKDQQIELSTKSLGFTRLSLLRKLIGIYSLPSTYSMKKETFHKPNPE